MLVSIVIPTYNARAFLPDALESALAQTYTNCEIIIIDDGSTDGTGDLVAECYGERVRYVFQANGGASDARNHGLRVARGELVQLLDADDVLHPEKVARGVAIFEQQPETVLVYTDYDEMLVDGHTVIPTEHPIRPGGDVLCTLYRDNVVAHSTVLMRRQAALDVGGYDTNLVIGEDWDLWLRLAAHGHTFHYIPERLVRYRQTPGGLHTDRVHMSEQRLAVIQKARHYPRRAHCLDDAAYDRMESGRWHRLALAYWEVERRAAARRALRAAIALHPSLLRRVYIWLSYVLPMHMATRLGRLKG